MTINTIRRTVPWALTGSRFALGPVMIAFAFAHAPPALFVTILTAALMSDIFDGVLARRWNTVTPALRVADSWADVCFYGCVGVSLMLLHPALAREFRAPLAIVLTLLGLRWAQDLTKYGRPASYHAILSRLTGAALFFACVAAFCFARPEPLFWCAFGLGVACHVEAAVITAVLPEWTHDVSSLRAALRLRNEVAGISVI